MIQLNCPYCDYTKGVVDVEEVIYKCNVLTNISDNLKKIEKEIEYAKEYCGSSSMAFEGASGEISSIDDTLDESKELAEKQAKKAESLANAIIGAAEVDNARQMGEYESHVDDCPGNPKNKIAASGMKSTEQHGGNSLTVGGYYE